MNLNFNTNKMKRLSNLKSYLYLILIVMISVSCECYEEPGVVMTESRQLTEFDALNIESVGKVNLYAAEEFKIIVKTHDNIINDIRTGLNTCCKGHLDKVVIDYGTLQAGGGHTGDMHIGTHD